MKTSKLKFTIIFVVCAFAFVLGTSVLLGQQPETLFASGTQIAWKSFLSTVLSPIKIILMGPLLPFIKFLHQDPDTPPPFFLVGFAIYWTILGLAVHYLLSKLKRA
ncbi:hypothetical protein [Mucilaginibacter sp. UYCu711]|uniref:hypothetical protein n=1 Tax=Mucilaginibacter sp. UYCu711 TaxID=3156339 RepID=UPI003D1E0A1A